MMLYLLTGLLIGALTGYFIAKSFLQKNFVAKNEATLLQQKLSALEIESATRLSKEEVSSHYVVKELYTSLAETYQQLQLQLKQEKENAETGRLAILQLTKESEQKISKEELEQQFVARQSFEIVQKQLQEAVKQLTTNESVILTLNKQLTELKQKEEHLNEKLSLFNRELANLHSLSKEQFSNLATNILEEKKKIFVESNKSEMSNLLTPLRNDLTQFKKTVEDTRKEDIRDLTSLKNEIDALQKLNTQLSDDAQNLANALKAEVKVQGNWGEDRLNLILETEGLQKYIDYKSQGSYYDEEQNINRRPDFILNLPNNKHIIIDSKVSLTAYVNYFNAPSPEEKSNHLKSHLKSVTDHIDILADKNYQSLAGLNTPDYVFLFVPIEGALTLAFNHNPEIFNKALKKKIVLITPTTLVATLKVVKILWQKENQVKNVEEIFRQCGLLYDKFVGFLEEMEKIGNGLQLAQKGYKDAMESLTEGTRKGHTIIGRFETIKKLEAKTNKSIPSKYVTDIDLLQDEIVPETKAVSATGDANETIGPLQQD